MGSPKKKVVRHDANRDPLSYEPGAHPVGVGLGATSGAVTGAVMGALAGPVGVSLGAAVGGVMGGLAGKALAEEVNPSVQEAYGRETCPSRPYASERRSYEAYEPACRIGEDRIRPGTDYSDENR